MKDMLIRKQPDEPLPEGTRVRFAEEAEVHWIENRREYTYQERSKIWFTFEEFKIIQHTIERSIASSLEAGIECPRGLESKTQDGYQKKKAASLDGICAVLLSQEQQRQHGYVDPLRIRVAYMEMNQVYVQEAIERAHRDHCASIDEQDADSESESSGSIEFKPQHTFTLDPLRSPQGRRRVHRLLFFRGKNRSDAISDSSALPCRNDSLQMQKQAHTGCKHGRKQGTVKLLPGKQLVHFFSRNKVAS